MFSQRVFSQSVFSQSVFPQSVFFQSVFLESVFFKVQSGASSRAKHGGAYFSAVYGSIKDPMAAPEPYETLEPPKLVGIATAPTLFTTSAKRHGSL